MGITRLPPHNAWVRVSWLVALTGMVTGCNLFRGAVLLMGPEQTRKVPAEYPHLAGKKACVIVWAEPYTLFDHPNVQLELAEHVRVALEGTVAGLSCVPSRQIVDYQYSHPDWDRESPGRLGNRFGVERVVLLELTEYTTREPESQHLKRAHIAANVKVYDTAYPDAEPVYKTAIETVYPPDGPAPYGVNEPSLRRTGMEAFAAQLAGKFYERREKVK